MTDSGTTVISFQDRVENALRVLDMDPQVGNTTWNIMLLLNKLTNIKHFSNSDYGKGTHVVTDLMTPAYGVGDDYVSAVLDMLDQRKEHLEKRKELKRAAMG